MWAVENHKKYQNTKFVKAYYLTPVVFLMTVPFLATCGNKYARIPLIDIDHPSEFIDLKISDIMEDISVVPLETRDGLLLNLWTSFIVTTDYILARTEEGLLQFDRQGNFLKILAFRGNGPNEYIDLLWPLVDEKREILYFSQYRDREAIGGINLKTGVFIEPFRHNLSYFHPQVIDSKGYIFGFRPEIVSGPFRDSSVHSNEWSSILAYRYHPQENEITIIKGSHKIEGGYTSLAYGNSVMFNRNDNIFFLLPNYSDTLFRIDGSQIVPQYIFKLKNKMAGPRVGGGGRAVLVHAAGQQGILFSKTEIMITERKAGTEALVTLFLDNKNNLSIVNALTTDLFGPTFKLNYKVERDGHMVTLSRVPIVTGMFAYLVMDPVELLPVIQQTLNDNNIDSNRRTQIGKLIAHLDEYSNPVLIIGKIK